MNVPVDTELEEAIPLHQVENVNYLTNPRYVSYLFENFVVVLQNLLKWNSFC